mgnify:CR=1 FL=1
MAYIVHRRYHGKTLHGEVNLPALTYLDYYDKYIIQGNKILCLTTSEIAHQYFACDDDGCGLQRGRLTQAIQTRLAKRDDEYQDRWDKVWDDNLCLKYKRPEFDDYWLWSHDFYEAPILDLQYIASLVGAKEVMK